MVDGVSSGGDNTYLFTKFVKAYANNGSSSDKIYVFGDKGFIEPNQNYLFEHNKIRDQHYGTECMQGAYTLKQMGGESNGNLYATIDKNKFLGYFKAQLGDKFKSMQEKLSGLFDGADTDKSKELTSDEFAAMIHQIDISDGTYDGSITAENFDNFLAKYSNNKGKIDVKAMRQDIQANNENNDMHFADKYTKTHGKDDGGTILSTNFIDEVKKEQEDV